MRSLVVEPVFITPWQIHLLSIQIQESTPSTDIIQMSVIFVTLQSVLLEQDYFLQTDFFIFFISFEQFFQFTRTFIYLFTTFSRRCLHLYWYWFSAGRYNFLPHIIQKVFFDETYWHSFSFFLQYLTIDCLACLHKSKPVLAMLMLKGTHNCTFQHHI